MRSGGKKVGYGLIRIKNSAGDGGNALIAQQEFPAVRKPMRGWWEEQKQK
jgi:hypothetical protein